MSAAFVLLATSFSVTSIGVVAASPPRAPRTVGPDSGARSSPLRLPSRPTRLPTTVNSVAAVNCDSGFHAVASPNGPGNNYLVSMSALSADDVWAVGNSVNAIGYDQSLVEHWDGTTWSNIPSPNPGSFHNDLSGVTAIAANDIWAVGGATIDAASTMAVAYAQHWNGSSWTVYNLQPVPNNQFSFMFAVTSTSSNDVWAVGLYDSAGFLPLVEHWNGTSWMAQFPANPSPSDNELFAVSAFSSSDVWAVGESTQIPGVSDSQSLAEHWNGTGWTVIPTANTLTGNNSILGVNALEAGHAVGVGFGNFVNGVSPRQSEAFDLVTGGPSGGIILGSALGTGDNALIAVDRSAAGVWAVGYSRPTTSAPRQTLVIPATWDSSGKSLTWGSAPGTSDSPGGANSVLEAVAAVSPYAFLAGGYQNNFTTFDQTLTEAYCARHFSLTAPLFVGTGSAFSLTVTVQDGAGATFAAYRGTVHFSSSDGGAALPANYTFTPGDNGTHTFTGVVLNTPGVQTITAADIAMPLTVPGSATISDCRGACQGPAGTPGARGASPGPAGTPGTRPANQSGAGSPGPRLPRLGSVPQNAGSAVGVALAPTNGPRPAVVAAPPAQQAVAAPAAVGVSDQTSTTIPEAPTIQPQVAAVMTDRTLVRASSQPRDNTSWLALALVPLAVLSLALVRARRRNNGRLNGESTT